MTPQDEQSGQTREQGDGERDRLAEKWLIDQHSPEWYIGDATDAEWDAAYVAAEQLASRGQA